MAFECIGCPLLWKRDRNFISESAAGLVDQSTPNKLGKAEVDLLPADRVQKHAITATKGNKTLI